MQCKENREANKNLRIDIFDFLFEPGKNIDSNLRTCISCYVFTEQSKLLEQTIF